MIIHVLDNHNKVVGVLANTAPFSCPFYEDLHTENIRTGTNFFTFSAPAGHKTAATLKADNRIVFPDMDGRHQLFNIIDVQEENSDSGYIKHVTTEHSAVTDLLTGGVVRPFLLDGVALDGAVNHVLDGTDYELGEWESPLAAVVEVKDYTTPLDALLTIATIYQVEIQYEVVFKAGAIQKRLIHMKNKLGRVTNKLFHYSKDLKEVVRTENSEALATALIGIGKGDEDGNSVTLAGYSPESLPDDFTKNPADDFIVSESAYQAYSRNGKHLFGLYVSDTAEDQKTLSEETVKELKARCVPFVTYEMAVATLERISGYEADKVRVGDTINVKDTSMNPTMMVEARILELSRSYTQPEKDEVVLGDYRPVKLGAYDDVDKIRQALIANENKWSKPGVSIPEVEEVVNATVDPIQRDVSSLQDEVTGLEVKIIRQATKPTGTDYLLGQLWMDAEGILHRWTGSDWEKIIKTTPGEIGAVDASEYTDKIDQLTTDIAGKIGAEYVDGKLVAKADKDYVEGQLGLKANTEYVDGKLVLKADAASVYKKTEVDTKIGGKADKVNVYTKTEVNNALDAKVSTTQYTTDQNNVIQRVENAESRITQTEKDITSKVSSTQYDIDMGDLSETMTNHESRITQTEKDITSKVSSTEYTTDKDGIIRDLTDHETRITQTEKDITSKVSSTEYSQKVTELDNSVSGLSSDVAKKANATDVYTKGQTDTKLGTKADDSKVTALETRMKNAETSITQTDKDIALKANATDVYTKTETNSKLDDKANNSTVTDLTTRVTEAESELKVQAGKIEGTVSKTEFTDQMTASKDIAWGDTASKNSTSVAAGQGGKWFRIATNPGSRAHARFILKDTTSSQHGTIVFEAGITYGNNPVLNLTSYSYYSAKSLTKARIVRKSTYDTVFLDVWVTDYNRTQSLEYFILDNVQVSGWDAVDWQPVESIPTGYTTKEWVLDFDRVADSTGQNTAKDTMNVNGKPATQVTTELTNHETRITQTEKDITSKVSSSTYNTDMSGLKTRMSTAESKISQTEKDITSKVSSSTYETDMNGLDTRMTSAESKIVQTTKDVTLSFQEIDGVKGVLDSATTTINKDGVTVKDGAFFLEDSNSGETYDITAKQNLILDHSFELVEANMQDIAVNYDWANLIPWNPYKRSPWMPVRAPKVALGLDPSNTLSGAMFGNQAICVRNEDGVMQDIFKGIKAGATYTLSAYFRRQINVVAGGNPFMEVWHVGPDGSKISVLASKEFPAVPADYAVKRHAISFQLPANFSSFDGVRVILRTTDTEWVQCDGVQMVEGLHPSIYQPEDSVWNIIAGFRYRVNNPQVRLWTGASYLHETQNIRPEKRISECTNGWILEWQEYEDGNTNRRFSHTHVPKQTVLNNQGQSHAILTPHGDTVTQTAFKYVYFWDDHFLGHYLNNDGTNRLTVLSAVYEY